MAIVDPETRILAENVRDAMLLGIDDEDAKTLIQHMQDLRNDAKRRVDNDAA